VQRAFHLVSNEGVDLFIRHAIRAGLDFPAAIRGEGRLLEDFAVRRTQARISAQSSGWLM
jgi:hypothetical protein